MANNSKVKTFISDYSISVPRFKTDNRHIIKSPKNITDNISLCGRKSFVTSIYTLTEIPFTLYSSIYKSLCPKCLNKMPEELVEELKYNYIVKKLKS